MSRPAVALAVMLTLAATRVVMMSRPAVALAVMMVAAARVVMMVAVALAVMMVARAVMSRRPAAALVVMSRRRVVALAVMSRRPAVVMMARRAARPLAAVVMMARRAARCRAPAPRGTDETRSECAPSIIQSMQERESEARQGMAWQGKASQLPCHESKRGSMLRERGKSCARNAIPRCWWAVTRARWVVVSGGGGYNLQRQRRAGVTCANVAGRTVRPMGGM